VSNCLIESGSFPWDSSGFPSDSFLSLQIPIFLDSRHPGDCVIELRISGGFYVLSSSSFEISGYSVLLDSRHCW